MSDFFSTNTFLFGFQIHHLMPAEMFVPFDDLLMRTGIELDMRGNKVALATDSGLASLFAGAADVFKSFLAANGWGWNPHFGNHSGYNRFFEQQLKAISEAHYTDPAVEKRAVFDLIRFGQDVSTGKIDGIDIQSDATSLKTSWDIFKIDPTISSGSDFDTINDFITDFNTSPVDLGQDHNNDYRFEKIKALADDALAKGFIGQPEYDSFSSKLVGAKVSADGSVNKPGHVTSAGISVLIDLKAKGLNIPLTSQEIAIKLANDFLTDESGAVRFGLELTEDLLADTIDKAKAIFSTIHEYRNAFVETLNDFDKSVLGEMTKSVDAMVVGLGGNALGDVVEFLNAAYEPIKKGFQTGEWEDFGEVVVQYGAGAVFSALLVAGSVAAATAAGGSVAASFVAAGWAAYGLYDAVTNGAELIGKISSDVAEIAKDVSNLIGTGVDSLEEFTKVVMIAFAENMDVPKFEGIFENAYLVDTWDITLPGAIKGSSEDEQFFGQNNAKIEAGAGNDEIYMLSSSGEAKGEEGNDVLVGNNAQYVPKGTLLNKEDREGIENPNLPPELEGKLEPAVAEADLRLTLDGGTGDDWLVVGGGTGVRLNCRGVPGSNEGEGAALSTPV